MASTNKTPQLGLNQWAAGDEVIRTDFNADNAKLEAAVTASPIVYGNYVGDSTEKRQFELGFKPTLLLLFGSTSNTTGFSFSFGQNYLIITRTGMYASDFSVNNPSMTETGFCLGSSGNFNTNKLKFIYLAFR